ncbi:hypothetical protein GW742_18100 [Citrobacter freundii]|nr:hypothetical protein [Citrobacter freundii]MBC6508300.1 hypothetical protein [Citrobacter freundii]
MSESRSPRSTRKTVKTDPDTAVKTPAPGVAPADGVNGQAHESPVTLPGYYIAVGAQSVSPAAAGTTGDSVTGDVPECHPAVMPQTDDVVVLEVRAVPAGGFWRCGLFWSHQGQHIFVSDDPEGDNAANNEAMGAVSHCFISRETAARLKADPNLIVTDVPVLSEPE